LSCAEFERKRQIAAIAAATTSTTISRLTIRRITFQFTLYM
jgi:hypothetical protein